MCFAIAVVAIDAKLQNDLNVNAEKPDKRLI